MNPSINQFGRDVIEGRSNGVGASIVRGGLSAAEPFYTGVMRARNFLFDRGIIKKHKLPRSVVSVGNITTGGTGKTPTVAWLAESFRYKGFHPAILIRGYKVGKAKISDEQLMLENLLNSGVNSSQPRVTVAANPDRLKSAEAILRSLEKVDVFILDDGFQHRRIERDFNLVLINSAEPFGHGHVLPRGLLREPLEGLKRADAILLTHANKDNSSATEQKIRHHHASVPIFRCDHIHSGFRTPEGDVTTDAIASKSFFAFCGIGDPESFSKQMQTLPGKFVGHRWFSDHHDYSRNDLAQILKEARAARAEILLTTQKDWAKISDIVPTDANALPIWCTNLKLAFANDDESRLFAMIASAVSRAMKPA